MSFTFPLCEGRDEEAKSCCLSGAVRGLTLLDVISKKGKKNKTKSICLFEKVNVNKTIDPLEVNGRLVILPVGPLLLLFGARRSSRASGAG